MMSFWIVLFTVIVSLILLFAIISNGLMICCVAKFKRLRTFTNVFICNLSVSDIILAGVIMPQKLHHVFHTHDFYEGDALCKISNFGPVFIITSSIYTLVVVSFERHKIIIESRAPKMSSYTLALVIVCIWMLSLIISLPTLMEYSTHAETEEHTERNDNYYEAHDIHEDENATINETVTYFHCDSNSSSEYALGNAVIVFVVAYYVIPVVLMLKNYFDIALFVWRKGRAQRDHVSTRTNNSSSFQLFKHKTKLVKLLVMVATIFAVSWFPYFVLFLYAKATGNDASKRAEGFANLFLIALAAFSTAYNVVLYVVFNPSVKQAMDDILKCTKRTDLQGQGHLNETFHTRISPCFGEESLRVASTYNKDQVVLVQPQHTVTPSHQ